MLIVNDSPVSPPPVRLLEIIRLGTFANTLITRHRRFKSFTVDFVIVISE
jgi:hypothetical protein